MGYLILPTLLLILVPGPGARAATLQDFSRLSGAIGQEVSLVDLDGLVRVGIVEAATGDGITLRVGSATQSFLRAQVASAERLKDGRIDGALKGAMLGFVMATLGSQGCVSVERCPFWGPITVMAGVGYLIDAGSNNREPLYRVPLAPAPSLKFSWRF